MAWADVAGGNDCDDIPCGTSSAIDPEESAMQPRFFLLAALFALPGTSSLAAEATGMFNLRSTDIAPGSTIGAEHVYKGFGCSGGNRSPELVWSHPPAGTKSFAVTVFDPDAPTGKGWWHWV